MIKYRIMLNGGINLITPNLGRAMQRFLELVNMEKFKDIKLIMEE